MTTLVISSCIKCGSKGTLLRLENVRKRENCEQITPVEFRCRRCQTFWNYLDVSIGQDLDRVCCSNCYGSNVIISRIKIVQIEARDSEQKQNAGE